MQGQLVCPAQTFSFAFGSAYPDWTVHLADTWQLADSGS